MELERKRGTENQIRTSVEKDQTKIGVVLCHTANQRTIRPSEASPTVREGERGRTSGTR